MGFAGVQLELDLMVQRAVAQCDGLTAAVRKQMEIKDALEIKRRNASHEGGEDAEAETGLCRGSE